MEQEALNRLRMLRATAAYLDEIKHIWEGNPMMQQEVGELRQLVARIETAHAKALAAAGKEQRLVAAARKEMVIEAITVIVNVTRTWAERTFGQELLVQRLSVRPYALRALSEFKLIARLEELYMLCDQVRRTVPAGMLGEPDYGGARTALDSYLELRDCARKLDVERQGENDNIRALLRQAPPLQKRLDRLMENYRMIFPAERAKYQAARTIYEYGQGKRAKSGPRKQKAMKDDAQTTLAAGREPGNPAAGRDPDK